MLCRAQIAQSVAADPQGDEASQHQRGVGHRVAGGAITISVTSGRSIVSREFVVFLNATTCRRWTMQTRLAEA